MNAKFFLTGASIILAAHVLGCSANGIEGALPDANEVSTISVRAIPNLDGTWTWSESQKMVVSAELGPLWGLVDYPDNPIHLTCTSGGSLELVQSGATFTGTGSQHSTCRTPDGAQTPTVPFPQGNEALGIEGRVVGQAIQFQALVGVGFHCPYRGSLRVSGGVVTEIRAAGRCETPIEVRPLSGSGISFEASR